MKRKLASLFISLTIGWLTTVAIAEEETTQAAADSTVSADESAVETDQSADSGTMDTTSADGTIAASPAETDAK